MPVGDACVCGQKQNLVDTHRQKGGESAAKRDQVVLINTTNKKEKEERQEKNKAKNTRGGQEKITV